MKLIASPGDPVVKEAEGQTTTFLCHKALSQVCFSNEADSKGDQLEHNSICPYFSYKCADLPSVSHLPFPLQFSCWQDEVVIHPVL